VQLPDVTKSRGLGYAVNGWQLSGITQIQSGANLSANSGENFGMNLNNFTIPGTQFKVSNVSILGTPNIQLNPILTCDPRSGLGPNQFINPNCFAIPSGVGSNGPTILPAIYGPAFFNSDLSIFKSLRVTEKRTIQIRGEAFNFLNHPLWSFNGNNLSLGFNGSTGQVNTPNFGTVTQKQGQRIVQLSVKFIF
jgi:hypothetical protein